MYSEGCCGIFDLVNIKSIRSEPVWHQRRGFVRVRLRSCGAQDAVGSVKNSRVCVRQSVNALALTPEFPSANHISLRAFRRSVISLQRDLCQSGWRSNCPSAASHSRPKLISAYSLKRTVVNDTIPVACETQGNSHALSRRVKYIWRQFSRNARHKSWWPLD